MECHSSYAAEDAFPTLSLPSCRVRRLVPDNRVALLCILVMLVHRRGAMNEPQIVVGSALNSKREGSRTK